MITKLTDAQRNELLVSQLKHLSNTTQAIVEDIIYLIELDALYSNTSDQHGFRYNRQDEWRKEYNEQ